MAEEALKKLEEQLSCSICLHTFTDPKLLQCFHVYCRQCLVPLVDRDQQGRLGLTCPICRQVTPIPGRGVAGLQSAFHINHFLEIQESLRKLESPAAALEGAVGGATCTVNEASSRDVGCCFEHREEYKLYCETCGELICWKCVLKGSKHHDHEYEELDKAFQKYKKEISSSLKPMENQVAIIKNALARFDTRHEEISGQQASIKDGIHITFRQLREVLNSRETELIIQVDQMAQDKLKGLAAQRDQIETTLAQLSSCLHFMTESLRSGNEGDVLMMKSNTMRQVDVLLTPFQAEPNTEANLAFSASADLIAFCQHFGQVVSPGLPDPSQCYATGSGIEVAISRETSTTILQTINFEGEPCKEPIKSLRCDLASEIADIRASCSVERSGQSQYKISYQPTIKGRHQLHIKAEGQHIRGSPFIVGSKSAIL